MRLFCAVFLHLHLVVSSITNSHGLNKALAAFDQLKPTLMEAGMSAEDYDKRRDTFVDSYMYLIESGKVGGADFEINPTSLLRQIDIIRLFGIQPMNDIAEEESVDLPETVEDQIEELIDEYGVDVVTEANMILMSHHGEEPEYQELAQFIQHYSQLYGYIEGDDEVERLHAALDNSAVQGILGQPRTKRFIMDETLKVHTGEEVLPIAERAFPHLRSFTFGQTGPKLGKFLDTNHYSDNLIQQCETLKKDNPAAVSKVCVETTDCLNVEPVRRCFYDSDMIPDEFQDWEDLGYIRSLMPYRAGTTLPAGWAHTATQIVDMYQQIYAKNVTWYRQDLTDLYQIMNCVYRTNGLARGSPMAAFQYMSDKYVVPKFGDQVPLNCRDGNPDTCGENLYAEYINEKLVSSSGDVFYKFLYLWDRTRKGQNSDFCYNTTIFEPSNSAIPDVQFMPGKAYIQFADYSSAEVWASVGSSGAQLITSYGEAVVKPLLYKKGPLAVIMRMCYEIFFVADEIFDFDCETYSTRQYLPQWVMLATYGPNYFGTVLPKIHAAKTLDVWYPDITKVSRTRERQFMWNSFVVPRVAAYDNKLQCQNGGRYIQTLVGDSCFCPLGFYGDKCEKECKLKCKNGGQLSHRSCACICSTDYYGLTCKKQCKCNYGRCDNDGLCICNRQKSWGMECQNVCNCKNGGYCHLDGTCECVAGFAGSTCEEPCAKTCKYPKVCRYSNQLTDTGSKFEEMCACPQGFYGEDCSGRVDCVSSDIRSFIECHRFKSRKRCYSDEGMFGCPHHCGHCYDLHVVYDVDS